jgi:NADH-quinone oxidoreductase subunit N
MWQQMFIILALLSVAVGNIIAIAQDNLKRMLAYSTISHMGFFLFGILSGTAAGYSAALFYVLIYATMSCAAFGLILYLSAKDFESDKLSDLKGLSKRNPVLALLLLITMFSMAGIPPTAGFFAKMSVIQALIDADLTWVAVVAVLLAVIGAYYYLRIVKLAYFDAPETEDEIIVKGDSRIVLVMNVAIFVVILPWIGSLINLCNQVISRLAL